MAAISQMEANEEHAVRCTSLFLSVERRVKSSVMRRWAYFGLSSYDSSEITTRTTTNLLEDPI